MSPKILTRAEKDALNFIRYAFGTYDVGSAEGEHLTREHAPELRSFVVGRLGDAPRVWWALSVQPPTAPEVIHRKALGEWLREIADVLDPVTEETPTDAG